MSDPPFLPRITPAPLSEIAAMTGATAAGEADMSIIISGVAPYDEAEPGELTFFAAPPQAGWKEAGRAAACFVTPALAHLVPEQTLTLVVEEPELCFSLALQRLCPQAAASSMFAASGISPGASIHPEARLEQNVTVDPGAVIGPRAEIGSGTLIGANCVIGAGVRIGRDCYIGPLVTAAYALIGNRVTLHPGVRLGQPGISAALPRTPRSGGSPRAPRLGRVIIQDGVEIGANATIDRGALHDTVIGEEARIGNLARIAENVTVGRHCAVAAQAHVAAGTELPDFSAV
ncbi:MAG TPA: UDP-3-O-(3-hydroxymyristoyl)glucosamine N-acyltransferase [Methylocella sp.]|nr:UDP-3-O-(3-hydroxymyristoyl)glucosamine N-acyltransferase [Methylocella sp.]